MRALVLGAVLAVAGAGAAHADNNTCRQSGGAWTVTGTIKTFGTFRGFYSIELSAKVAAKPPEVRSALQPVITGECLVGWGAGDGSPEGCKEGVSVTMTGPVSFDDKDVAGIQVRQISCK
jgi:hypothetical protein